MCAAERRLSGWVYVDVRGRAPWLAVPRVAATRSWAGTTRAGMTSPTPVSSNSRARNQGCWVDRRLSDHLSAALKTDLQAAFGEATIMATRPYALSGRHWLL